MEETKSTTIELKNIEAMPQAEFNDMIGKILGIRYPEANRISVYTKENYHMESLYSVPRKSRRTTVNVVYN